MSVQMIELEEVAMAANSDESLESVAGRGGFILGTLFVGGGSRNYCL